VLMIAAGA